MKKAVIIGATSGIGRELAVVLSDNGYHVCITGRRLPLLQELQSQLSGPVSFCQMDVCDIEETRGKFRDILSELGCVDLVIISAGTGFLDPDFSWEKEQKTIDTNVSGFVAIANMSFHHFVRQGAGQLAGISSLAAIRGGPGPAYNASKAFESLYMEGLRFKIAKLGLPIFITDIRPGFVDTQMAKGKGLFWVQSPRKAALQIYEAIKRRKKVACITKRWVIVSWILRVLPDWIYHKW